MVYALSHGEDDAVLSVHPGFSLKLSYGKGYGTRPVPNSDSPHELKALRVSGVNAYSFLYYSCLDINAAKIIFRSFLA